MNGNARGRRVALIVGAILVFAPAHLLAAPMGVRQSGSQPDVSGSFEKRQIGGGAVFERVPDGRDVRPQPERRPPGRSASDEEITVTPETQPGPADDDRRTHERRLREIAQTVNELAGALAIRIRSLDQSYSIPGVSSGQAATAASEYRQPKRTHENAKPDPQLEQRLIDRLVRLLQPPAAPR
jgi:hypothetical protein